MPERPPLGLGLRILHGPKAASRESWDVVTACQERHGLSSGGRGNLGKLTAGLTFVAEPLEDPSKEERSGEVSLHLNCLV